MKKIIVVITLSLSCAGLLAAPAPWWKWRSKIDGALVCSQTPLGPGWEQAYGPYKDSRCEKPVNARMPQQQHGQTGNALYPTLK